MNSQHFTPGTNAFYKWRALQSMQALRHIKDPLLMTEYYKLMLTTLKYMKKK